MISANVKPVVIEVIEAVASLDECKCMLDIEKKEVDRVQFSALVRSARILGKILDIHG